MVTPQVRREALRAFLIERRKAISPADVGLRARRRSGGLSQGNVAALAGISLNWYALFESGREERQVSTACLEAIARALRLTSTDELEFYRLALPRSQVATSIAQNWRSHSLLGVRSIRQITRKLAAASGLSDIALIVSESMQTQTNADCATLATIKSGERIEGLAVGPRAGFVRKSLYAYTWHRLSGLPPDRVGIVPPGPTLSDYLEHCVDVTISTVGDVDEGPLSEWRWTPQNYREVFQGAFAVNSMSLPLYTGDRLGGLVSTTWTVPHEFTPLEIETARTVSAIVQLVALGP